VAFKYDILSEHPAFLYEVRTHPDVNKMLTGDPPQTYEEHKDFIIRNHKRFFIAYDEEIPVGYSQYTELIPGRSCALGFAVHPDHQGKGYGDFLVAATMSRLAKEYDHMTLCVLKKNMKALHLYKKHGFTILGGGPDRLWMQVFYGQRLFDIRR
jgi:ribosomal protein S18 acetylase RimI-like enzyme